MIRPDRGSFEAARRDGRRDDAAVSVNSARETLKMLAPHWPLVLIATVSIVLFTLANLARPIIIKRAIDDGLVADDGGVLVIAAIVFVATIIAIYVFQAASTYLTALLGQQFMRDLRIRLFGHYQKLSMSFFDRENSGRLVSRMTADMNALTDMLNNGFLVVIQSVLLLTGTIIILFTLSWQLSLVALAIVPPLVAGTLVFRIYSERAYESVRDRIADVLVHMQESFAGIRVVKAFGREEPNMQRFGAINEDNFEANVRTVRISAMYIPLVELLSGLGIGLILYFGGRWVIGGSVTVGTVAAFIFYLDFIFQPIQRLSQVYDMLQSALAALNKIFRLLAVEPEIQQRQQPVPLPASVAGAVRFDNVSFSYNPETKVLEDVDFAIEPGSRVALVGPTGAGKSTIAKLALRFYDPDQGRVLLDGCDLRDLSFEDMGRAVVLVPQEGFLFSGTIRENILFGRPGATEGELVAACRDLGVHDFIQSLPDGYDTVVSHRGSSLSAGEKQLISLARAFLADPPVLILDEATSSLDPRTESLVEDAIRRLYTGRTTIIVAHRLSTAEHADRVLVIDGGNLVEDGHHDELARGDGLYAALYQKWAPAAEPATP
jgi:ATP-binding cassette subfamily B protein